MREGVPARPAAIVRQTPADSRKAKQCPSSVIMPTRELAETRMNTGEYAAIRGESFWCFSLLCLREDTFVCRWLAKHAPIARAFDARTAYFVAKLARGRRINLFMARRRFVVFVLCEGKSLFTSILRERNGGRLGRD